MTLWQFNAFSIALIASGMVSFILFVVLLRTRKEPLSRLLALGLLAEAEWSIFVGLAVACTDLPIRIILNKISYVGVYNCVPLFLLFTIHYVGQSKWLTPRKIMLMWAAPVIVILLATTNEYHHLIWTGFVPSPQLDDNVYYFLRGPFYWLGVVSNYFMLLAITILIYRNITTTSHTIYRHQSLLMLISVVPPWMANLIYVIQWEPLKGKDLTPMAFSLSGLLIFISLYYFRLLDLTPVARDALFERIKDAFFVLDTQNRLVDVNAAGEKLLGADRENLVGQPAAECLKAFPSLIKNLNEDQDLLTECTYTDATHRNLEIHCDRLFSLDGEGIGRLVTIQDITLRKHAEETEREERQLAEALRDVALAVTSTLDISEVLDRLLENIYRVLPCTMTNILLVDEQGIARVAHYRGYVDQPVIDWLQSVTFDVEEVFSLRWMNETGQPLVVPDTHAVDYWKIKDDTLRGYLGAPIWVKGKAVGFINLDHSQPGFYNADHAETLSAYADLAAIAIENARLFVKINELAIKDGLTGIYNRRHLFDLSASEVQRSRRYQKSLSLLLLDIDHFKTINDTYGHQVGDVALRKIAILFNEALRDIDIIGRYGGDEFCVLMPETDEQNALVAARRLLDNVRKMEINTAQGIYHLTISIGISTLFPEDEAFDVLLYRADQALYTAKENGRNRIEIYKAPEAN